jgi:hypothetical protein
MERVAQVGRFVIETNGSGEVFLTVGKTKLRVSNGYNDDIQITFAAGSRNGEFIPDNINRLPAMIFRGR